MDSVFKPVILWNLTYILKWTITDIHKQGHCTTQSSADDSLGISDGGGLQLILYK